MKPATICAAFLISLCGLLSASAQEAEAPERPRRIILFIGDGMGFAHVDATNCYEFGDSAQYAWKLPGQLEGDFQPYEKYPVRLAMSTFGHGQGYDPAIAWKTTEYLLDATDGEYDYTTESAASITAISTGAKTDARRLGQDAAGNSPLHLMERAEALGMATGVVSSVPFSHATPAGCVVHVPKRSDYEEISRQMIMGSGLEVIMGCGHPVFRDKADAANLSEKREKLSYRYIDKAVWDSLQAGTAGGDMDGDGDADPWSFVSSSADFDALAAGSLQPARLLGMPETGETLQLFRDGDDWHDREAPPFDIPLKLGVPSLATMALGALNLLERDPEGFVVMIEGGAIDWAGHSEREGGLLEEMQSFSAAVSAVEAWVEAHGGWEDTLLVVTADHECGCLVNKPSGEALSAQHATSIRSKGQAQLPQMRFMHSGHTNQLVPLYAKGSGAESLQGIVLGLDPVFGLYTDNAALGRWLHSRLAAESQ